MNQSDGGLDPAVSMARRHVTGQPSVMLKTVLLEIGDSETRWSM